MTNKEFLEKVEAIINNDRAKQYGNADSNFNTVAEFWSTYLAARGAAQLTPKDVAVMMVLFKAARLSVNINHFDSWLDSAGYAALGGVMEVK